MDYVDVIEDDDEIDEQMFDGCDDTQTLIDLEDVEIEDDDDETFRIETRRSFENIDARFETTFVLELTPEEINENFKTEMNHLLVGVEESEVMAELKQEVESAQDMRVANLTKILDTAQITDSAFIETELKGMITSSKKVLDTLQKDLRVGAQPRAFEVYATVVNAITGQLKELRSLNESRAKLYLENKKQNLDEVKEQRQATMSSADALEMYLKAKQNSKMGEISTEFEIIDDGGHDPYSK